MNYQDIFHVHTWRCRHTDDDNPEEIYILKAIELGSPCIYITDHGPFQDDLFGMRMKYDIYPAYLSELKRLKEKYKGYIDIKTGVEIEYVPLFMDHYKRLREDLDVLLLGQHFSWLSDGKHTFEERHTLADPQALADGMMAGMETRLFDVCCHPDQIFRRCLEWTDAEAKLAEQIKDCALANNVIMEKNIRNIRTHKKKHCYRTEFWEDYSGPFVFAVDAHSVKELEENYKIQLSLVKEIEDEWIKGI